MAGKVKVTFDQRGVSHDIICSDFERALALGSLISKISTDETPINLIGIHCHSDDE